MLGIEPDAGSRQEKNGETRFFEENPRITDQLGF